MDASAPDATPNLDRVPAPDTDADADAGVIFLVPFRWWRQCQSKPGESGPVEESSSSASAAARSISGAKGIAYTATASASSSSSSSSSYYRIINNIIFSSDLAFNLRRDGEGPSKDDAAAAAAADEGISGRSYALIASDMWSHALRWHREAASEADVYTLKLRVSVLQDANVISVKISKKDNAIESYKRACKIFSVDSEMVRIWDFSGRTNLILMDEWNRMAQDSQSLGDQEDLLELQVYALSESGACRSEGKKDDSQSKMTSFPYGGQLLTNGSIRNMDSDVRSIGSSKVLGSLGLIGLENLGNTCFMNSAIQCLAHTPKLVEFFLDNYNREINHHNPLGMNGEIALAFGELLRKLWAPDRTPVAPRVFKGKLARFAPQFSGYNQHDSQELLAFLLDGLHEDLNRVKCKPYIEVKDACGRADEEVADEYWSNHLARNDSIIVDICQGQYRSTLVCPVCNKVSVTFDPFMYLSLPLPSSATRTMTITVFSSDGSAGPSSYTITVPKFGKCKDLMRALSIACSLRDDENLLIAEVYNSRIIRYLEDSNDSISLIRDGDCLAAYRISKDLEELPLVIFTHQRMERSFSIISSQKAFGVPFVARLPSLANGCTLGDMYLKLLKPFLRSPDAASATDQASDESCVKEVSKTEISSSMPECEGRVDAIEGRENAKSEFQYYVTDEKCKMMLSKIEMDEPILSKGLQKQLYVLVCWQDKALEDYDICLLSSLPEIYKPGLFAKRIQEPISLYACLEAFLKEEPLGPEDMWYCPNCKEHQQASKKLDLWRLPEVLVFHLKRFSYSRFMKNKLETFVDFPIHKLDLSGYIARKTDEVSHCYNLYAISNHYGNMGGGHYTAYVYHEGQKCWYDFDDRHVNPIPEETTIKTSAAYVLFYRKGETSNQDVDSTTAAEP